MNQTFKQFLTEVFDYHAPFRWEYIDDDCAKASFILQDVKYDVMAEKDEDYDHSWDISFDTARRPPSRMPYTPTNFGQQFTVLSTVKFVAIDLIRERPDILQITFSADSPSRIRAYNRLATSIANDLPGNWLVKTIDRGIRRYFISRES